MSARWRVLLALSFGLPVAAQVQWVSPNDALATGNPVYLNDARERVCRVQTGSNTYAGTERSGQCHYAVGSQNQVATTYQVAAGLGKWEGAGLAGPSSLGDIDGLPTRVCRAKVNGAYVAGHLLGANPPACQLPVATGFQSVTNYEQLYDFDFAGEFQIRQRDLCLASRPGLIPNVQLIPCADLPQHRWKLQAAAGGYRIESVSSPGSCVSRTTVFLLGLVGQLAACSQAPAFNPTWIWDTSYRLNESGTGQILSRAGNAFSSPALVTFGAPAGTNNENFELLTINEASRRLSVLSYNIMLLPSSVFPGLKHDDRADWIPQALNRLGILADVLTFQEGFQNSARARLLGNLIGQGYLYFSGVPDWPSGIYLLGSVSTMFLAQPYQNGGVFISSRWPIDRYAYYRFSATSGDGLFDTTGFDALSAKGVTYARVNKLGRRYHIFTTHLQAGSPDDEGPIRRQQLQEMRNFADQQLAGASAEDGVIFTGDFNIDMEADVSNYNFMLNTLSAEFVDAPRPVGTTTAANPVRWTVDPVANDISNKRDSSFEWLDYIFRGRQGARIDRASYLVFQPEHTEEYRISVETLLIAAFGFETKDLSDHGAVFGRFVFRPSANVVQPSELVATELLTTSFDDPIPNGVMLVDQGSVLTPHTLTTVRGETFQIGAISPLPGSPGVRYVFNKFSDNKPQSFSHTANANTRFRAEYNPQYQFRPQAVPAGAGTFNNAFEFFNNGSELTVTATPAPGFRFVSFTEPRNTTENPTRNLIRDRPLDLVATFESIGAPRLSLTTNGLPRQYLANQVVRIPVAVSNAGTGGATNVRVQAVSATVLMGTGSITVNPQSFANIGTVPLGGPSPSGNIDVFWPTTATRARINFLITADGGYSVPFSLTLFR